MQGVGFRDLRRSVAILGAARLRENRHHVVGRELQLATRPLERQELVQPAMEGFNLTSNQF